MVKTYDFQIGGLIFKSENRFLEDEEGCLPSSSARFSKPGKAKVKKRRKRIAPTAWCRMLTVSLNLHNY